MKVINKIQPFILFLLSLIGANAFASKIIIRGLGEVDNTAILKITTQCMVNEGGNLSSVEKDVILEIPKSSLNEEALNKIASGNWVTGSIKVISSTPLPPDLEMAPCLENTNEKSNLNSLEENGIEN